MRGRGRGTEDDVECIASKWEWVGLREDCDSDVDRRRRCNCGWRACRLKQGIGREASKESMLIGGSRRNGEE